MQHQLYDSKTKKEFRKFLVKREYNYFMTLKNYYGIKYESIHSLFYEISNIFSYDNEEIVMFPEANNNIKGYHLHFLILTNRSDYFIKSKLYRITRFDVDLSIIIDKNDVVNYVTKYLNSEFNIKQIKNMNISNKDAKKIKLDNNLVDRKEAAEILDVDPVTVFRMGWLFRRSLCHLFRSKQCQPFRRSLCQSVNNFSFISEVIVPLSIMMRSLSQKSYGWTKNRHYGPKTTHTAED